ncbi:MAG: hypothetical protein Q9227_002201 [Pyrenula ochraceoflavens]
MYTLFPAVLFAIAAPLLAHPLDNLATRASPETVYLSNCNEFEPGIHFSEIDYYAAGSSSQNLEQPTDTCGGITENGGWVTWGGKPISCKFSDSGVTFTSNIAGNGQSVAQFSKAGTGSNGFKNFNCFRDNQRTLYTRIGVACKSFPDVRPRE